MNPNILDHLKSDERPPAKACLTPNLASLPEPTQLLLIRRSRTLQNFFCWHLVRNLSNIAFGKSLPVQWSSVAWNVTKLCSKLELQDGSGEVADHVKVLRKKVSDLKEKKSQIWWVAIFIIRQDFRTTWLIWKIVGGSRSSCDLSVGAATPRICSFNAQYL